MTEKAQERVIVGNWKMHKTHAEAESYLKDLLAHLQAENVSIFLAVPFTLISLAVQLTAGTRVIIGAQNMNDASEGAFTGEISGRMLVEAGAQFVIIGHSERRKIFGEDDAFINRKVRRALESGLKPILCVGETFEEREAGKTHERLAKQLKEGLADVPSTATSALFIAYEPVWAIGTGEVATPPIIAETHAFIHETLNQLWPAQERALTPLLYGGSVQTRNAGLILEQPYVNGLLVGGASLSAELFNQIVKEANILPKGIEA